VVDPISFEDAIERTKGEDCSLLIGNGFSIEHFRYENLLNASGLEHDEPVRRLFETLGTFDFELVIRALEDAGLVEATYGNEAQADRFQGDANRLREALVHAVRTTHPGHREDIEGQIPSCVRFLKHFKAIFTLNYDLLLYWVLVDADTFSDGFGLGTEANGFRGPFMEQAYCNIYNVHGGLHLFKRADGDVEKRIRGPSGVIDAIATSITEGKRLPLYVAEGTSSAKLGKINSVPYLRHCYDQLSDSAGNFFIYGHSASQNDAHIYRALFTSRDLNHLYFFIHQPTANLQAIDGELARYQRLYASHVDYIFVDAESARVWNYEGRPSPA